MRRMLHALALRLGKGVWELEAFMPARELHDWILYFNAEAKGAEPPSIDDVGPDQFAAAMGADVPGVNTNGS